MRIQNNRFFSLVMLFAVISANLQTTRAAEPPKPPGIRSGYTVTALHDGTWLLAGGYARGSDPRNQSNYPTNESLIHDPTQGTWTNTGAMTTKRVGHAATVLPDGRVMVVGGEFAGNLSSAEIYDPSVGQWTKIGSLNVPRSSHTATLLADGRVLVTGGLASRTNYPHLAHFASAELYDPVAERWTMTDPMSIARFSHTATLLTNGLVLVAGGWDQNHNFLFSTELFNPSTGKWSITGSMPYEARFFYTATLLTNGQVSLTTSDTNAWIAGTLLYDPLNGQWNEIGPRQPHFISSKDLDRTLTISPESGSSFLASQEIELMVESADRFGVTNISVFRDGLKVGEGEESPMRYTVTNTAAGTYTFVAKAAYANGLASISSPASITFKETEPRVFLAPGPTEFISETHVKTSPAILLVSIVGVNPDSLAQLTLNGTPQPLRTGNFTLNPPLTEGKNLFVLMAKDKQGRTAKAETDIYLHSTSPTITITDPRNNASLNVMRVGVRGKFTGESLKEIRVNGMPAFIKGDAFETLNVFLEPGTNTIAAIAEDVAGNFSTNSIAIMGPTDTNVYGIDPVQLVADCVGGFAPLKVSFKVQARVPGEIKRVFYDFDSDHVVDKTVTDLQPITVTFTEPGERFPVVTLETTAGRFSSLGQGFWFFQGTRINVQAPPVVLSTINISDPVDIKCTASNHLYVLSGNTATLTEFDTNGKIIRSVKNIGAKPTGFDVDEAGNVYVAISSSNQVWKFKPVTDSFEPDLTFGNVGFIGNKDGSSGSKSNELNAPFDVALIRDFEGEVIMVSDSGNHRIQRFTQKGVFSISGGVQMNKDGVITAAFGGLGTNLWQFNKPKGLAFDGLRKHLFIADSANDRVVVAHHEFGPQAASGESGTALGQFRGPINLCASDRGLGVAETGNDRIQIFDPVNGGGERGPLAPFKPRITFSSELGLKQPKAIAWLNDLLEEKIYIADTGNNRVILVKLPSENPEAVWSKMKARLAAGDVSGAISHFSIASKDKYQQAFLSLSKEELHSAVKDMDTIKPVSIENDKAQYYFVSVIEGQKITFPIEFVKENGQWKIMEY